MEERRNKLSLKSKGLLILLLIVTISIFIAWSKSFKDGLNKPFDYEVANVETDLDNDVLSACPNGICPLGREADLKKIDTDKDGLTDWQELYVYGTSPYLVDSDSDGVPDGTEIRLGDDPFCLGGQDCGSENPLLNEKASGDNGNLENLSDDILDDLLKSEPLDVTESSIEEQELVNLLSGEVTPDILRSMLLSSGVDKELLEMIDDDALMESYQQTLDSQ